jgi:hypothetical protein
MKYFICLLSLFIAAPCFITKTQSKATHKKRDEQWAVAQISALPEVKAFMRYAKKSDPLVMIAGDPDSTRKYYWVKVGVSNFGMFRTSDDFLIDPKTSEIYFWNIALELEKGDKTATLKQWRQWRSDPRFWKPHTFKNGKLIALAK